MKHKVNATRYTLDVQDLQKWVETPRGMAWCEINLLQFTCAYNHLQTKHIDTQ